MKPDFKTIQERVEKDALDKFSSEVSDIMFGALKSINKRFDINIHNVYVEDADKRNRSIHAITANLSKKIIESDELRAMIVNRAGVAFLVKIEELSERMNDVEDIINE